MKKNISFALCIIFSCAILSGCGDEKENESTETTTETTIRTEASETSSDAKENEQNTSDDFPQFDEVVIDTFISNEPFLNSLVSDFKASVCMTSKTYMYVENSLITYNAVMAVIDKNKYYVCTDTSGMNISFIADGDDCYMCLPDLKTYQKGTKEDIGFNSIVMSFNIYESITYTESANVTINGEKLIREEYNIPGLTLYYYFTKDGIPVYNYNKQDENITLNVISEYTNDVDDSLFEIPEGYEKIGE